MTSWIWELPDEDVTADWSGRLADVLPGSLVVALAGDLGAGKTTLVRALLRSLGHLGPVPSPTYTLIETYDLGAHRIHHLDLYRLAEPEELEFIGLRDLLDEQAVLLVEWPQRGEGVLPGPDLTIQLSVAGTGRRLTLQAGSSRGERVGETIRDGRSSAG